jgi:hypothetical protein
VTAYGRLVSRGGGYCRLVLPGWADALDSGYSLRAGGRWNAAASFGALYLNDSVALARLQASHRLARLPYGIEDLDPSEQHDLVSVEVAVLEVLDCVSDAGLQAVGLPDSYPRDPSGKPVPWRECQPVGQAAFDDGTPGLACRSAATGAADSDEELAVFATRSAAVTETARLSFEDWFWA